MCEIQYETKFLNVIFECRCGYRISTWKHKIIICPECQERYEIVIRLIPKEIKNEN